MGAAVQVNRTCTVCVNNVNERHIGDLKVNTDLDRPVETVVVRLVWGRLSTVNVKSHLRSHDQYTSNRSGETAGLPFNFSRLKGFPPYRTRACSIVNGVEP